MVIFSVVATKGGVGKTTLSANIGALIADMGLRVLLVDADIQASLSKYYPLTHPAPVGLTDVVTSGTVSERAISKTAEERLDLIVCDAPHRALTADPTHSDLERYLQRRMDMPDSTVQVLQGLMFVVLLVSETLYGRFSFFRPKAGK